MKTGYLKEFLRTNYRPKTDREIIAKYYIGPQINLTKGAIQVTTESSIGTWTKLSTLSQKIFQRLAPKIFRLDFKSHIASIAYPLELFELGNVSQLLSGLAGNIFSIKTVENLRLLDLHFPEKYCQSFPGPYFGIEGVRQILKIGDRPIIGSIIKPKLGLNAKQHADLAYSIWKNGVEVIKDDENLTSLSFNPFEQRVKLVMRKLRQVEKETQKPKIHVFNVTGPADLMLKRAKLVKAYGGRCVMIDLVACGLDNVQFLRQQNLKLILHGHRAGHAAFSRYPKHGISMLVIAKLARLCGIDQLHTGTVVGKMEGEAKEVLEINRAIQKPWGKLKPVLAIASGGLHPGLVPELVKILGNKLMINFGGGLHGHPQGSSAGAKACFDSINATAKKIKLATYAKTHPELKAALEYWKS